MRQAATAAAEIERDPASPWYALAKGALGLNLYLSGEATAAAGLLEEAVASKPSIPIIRMLAFSALSLVMVELGRLAKAEQLAHAALNLADYGDLREAPPSSLAYTASAAVHAGRGQLGTARSELESALQSHRRVPEISPWATLEATFWLARVVLDLGDRTTAAELAGEARDILAALPDGTQAQQARLAELDRRIAGRSRRVSVTEPLTEREIAVLRLLGGTLSLREIGQELFVSANTIKTHTQRIYRKLGVSTRREAIAQGKQAGILLYAAALSAGSPG
jgi:LuxR family transcriptional regulator, maltose regulon positive regulatory protein